MNALSAYGLIGHALIFGALLALPGFGEMRSRIALAATTLSLIVGIAPGLHGLFGFPSVTLVGLALWRLAGRGPSPLGVVPAATLLLGALLFYGCAQAGLDPYALGYQPGPILIALVPVAGALWWRGQPAGVWILAVDLAAYASGLFPNVWDVLIDPLLLAVATFVVGRHVYLRFSASAPR